VTGTQANRSIKTTGNEASTAGRSPGTDYMGGDIFRTFCQGEAKPLQPRQGGSQPPPATGGTGHRQ